MARVPLDELPQRELLDRLRVEITRAMSGSRAAARRVDALVAANPNSWESTYVAYNLGKRKFTWLWSRVADTHATLPRRRDAATSDSWALVEGWVTNTAS